jgi:cytochrome c biogenesis protein CcdA/thiol-disulfide isomerase/thioredoxin
MLVLLAIGFVAGLLTIISPCILPVLPAVIASGVTVGGRRRAVAIAAGLSLAFGLSALFSIRLLQALHLPLGLRYDIAIVVLFIVAAGLIVPRLGELVERPFARLGGSRGPKTDRGGLVLGASLGLLYLPCGGPILATIAAVGSPSSSINARAVGLTAAYSLGIGLPVFWLVLAADRVAGATTWLRAHALATRRVGGVLLAVSAVAITFGAATSLQTAVPSYTATIENHLTADKSIKAGLAGIGNRHETLAAKRVQQSIAAPAAPAAPASAPTDQVPTESASALKNYGQAPNFTNVTKWLNTPDGASLNLASLRGKVVLIDFWTYSCINCLRSLPHVKAWYSRYHAAGLDVIGVHTPEFDFEHVASNVSAAISRLGVTYPVAMDNDYGTWNAWGNNSWPAEYLIDAKGNVRYGSIGEGEAAGHDRRTGRHPAAADVAGELSRLFEADPLRGLAGGRAQQARDVLVRLAPQCQPAELLRPVDRGRGEHQGRAERQAADERLGRGHLPRAVRYRDRHRHPGRKTVAGPACFRGADAVHDHVRAGDAQRHPCAQHQPGRLGVRLHVRLVDPHCGCRPVSPTSRSSGGASFGTATAGPNRPGTPSGF